MNSLPILLLLLCCCNLAASACESGWLSFQDSCYKYMTVRKQWSDAKTYCETQKAHLAIVMSNDENNFLKAELRKLHIDNAEQIWMDGTDIQTEGTFIWEHTGELLEISDWGPNEPNQNNGDEDCNSLEPLEGF